MEKYVYIIKDDQNNHLVFAWERSSIKDVLCHAARVFGIRINQLEFAGKIDPEEIGTYIMLKNTAPGEAVSRG